MMTNQEKNIWFPSKKEKQSKFAFIMEAKAGIYPNAVRDLAATSLGKKYSMQETIALRNKYIG